MTRRHEHVFALNAGGVDPEALSRVDLERTRIAGEHPVANWLPRVLGPMSMRPGLMHQTRIPDDAVTRQMDFVTNSSDATQIAVSATEIRFLRDDSYLQVGNAGAVAVSDPTFAGPAVPSGIGGWANNSEAGAGGSASVTFTGATSGLVMRATKYRAARVSQRVLVAIAGVSHTITIVVARGPVYLSLGSTATGTEYFDTTPLGTGTHKITVTSGGAGSALFIALKAIDVADRIVSSVRFEHTILPGNAGNLVLPSPWSADDLPNLTWHQSGDVLFVCDGRQVPKRIERRGTHSWSIVDYVPRVGPWLDTNQTNIQMSCSVTVGTGTLTASEAYFHPGMVGSLLELTHQGKSTNDYLDGNDQETDAITIVGVGADRAWAYSVSVGGGWVGQYALQRALDANQAAFSNTATAAGASSGGASDGLNNIVAAYRIQIPNGAWTSGFIQVVMTYGGGSYTGIVRITGYTSQTQVTVEVLSPLGQTTATRTWRQNVWSNHRGWPQALRFFDGRLFFFHKDTAYGSVVDDYTSFDDTVEGDSGPIIRSVGAGAVEGAVWALDMQRLIVGTTAYEASIRASSFDEPLTPTAFTVRNASSLGVAKVTPAKVDRTAFFIQKHRRRLYELSYSGESNDYASQDISRLNPAALAPKVKRMAVQRQPDTRLYLVLDDGTGVVLTYEKDDKVVAFTTIATDGVLEDVITIPGATQDRVCFVVARTISGATQRFHERLSDEAEQMSGATCTLLDAFKVLTGSVSSITGGQHLAGRTVQVWADGQLRSDATLDGAGSAALGATYARVVYGLNYDATWKSTKLAYAGQIGTAIGQTKEVRGAALILSNSTLDGIWIAPGETERLDPMPDIVKGAPRTPGQMFAHYDQDVFPINSEWTSDARLYIKASSKYGPKTVQSIVLDIETRDIGAQKGNG